MNYPQPSENHFCQCQANPMAAFWCQTGHMRECHYPYNCQQAACNHLFGYGFSLEDIEELEATARANMAAGLMPEYQVDEHGNATAVSTNEMFGRYAQAILDRDGWAGLEAAFAAAGFERSEADGVVTFTSPDDPEVLVTMRYVDEEE